MINAFKLNIREESLNTAGAFMAMAGLTLLLGSGFAEAGIVLLFAGFYLFLRFS